MENIKLNKNGSVLEIVLNRPDKRNSFNPEMIQELTKAFSNIGDARVVLLRGEGTSFCTGADLEWMKSVKNFTLEENRKDSETLYKMFEALKRCPVPVIGQVHGHVMGGALGLLALCDIAAAEKETKFCFSEVKLGLVPAVISPFVLSKMPIGRARRWMLTGEIFGATEASQDGLVNFVGSMDEVNKFVSEILDLYKKLGPQAVKDTKYLLTNLSSWTEEKSFKETTRVIAERRVSDEGQEGLASFLEKRSPSWYLKQ